MAKKTNKANKVVLAAPDRRWEIDNAMRTLQEAQRIQKDKALMGEVKKSAQDLNKMLYGGTVKKKK